MWTASLLFGLLDLVVAVHENELYGGEFGVGVFIFDFDFKL